MLSRILLKTLQADEELRLKQQAEKKRDASQGKRQRVRRGTGLRTDAPFDNRGLYDEPAAAPSAGAHNLNLLRRWGDHDDGSDHARRKKSDSSAVEGKSRRKSSNEVSVGLGINDGQAFADRLEQKKSLSSLFSVPSSGTLLLRGFDLEDNRDEPNVPHRQASASPSFARGALSALFQAQGDCTPADGGGAVGSRTAGEQAVSEQEMVVTTTTTTSSSSSSNSTSTREMAYSHSSPSTTPTATAQQQQQQHWARALTLAAMNVSRRGGERSSEDVESSLAALLAARRRRQAFELFRQNKDVPLDATAYDQLLRTFITDRDHATSILSAMEEHEVLQDILRSGERSSVAQAVFESMALHDWRGALLAFKAHSKNYDESKQKQQQQELEGPSPPPVYSGLLVALLRRGLKGEALTLVDALSGSDAQRDMATGLIRCLHAESDEAAAMAVSAASKQHGEEKAQQQNDAITFTEAWLAKQQQMEENEDRKRAVAENVKFFDQLCSAGGGGAAAGHPQTAVRVFAHHSNPYTCAALAKFLLSHRCPAFSGSTPVLQEAIASCLFAPQQQQQSGKSAGSISSLLRATYSSASSSSPAAAAAASSETAIHLARYSVARAIMRRGHWSLAMSMAQSCLRARVFDPVAPLAGTVARSGRWNAALRLGTQLFALRRTPPSASELSLCVHASLWSAKWSSALFWVERAHTRGLKFDPSVYDAAFSAAAAAAAATAVTSTNRSKQQQHQQQSFISNTNSSAAIFGNNPVSQFEAAANFALHSAGRNQASSAASDAAIRTVKCMAESGGTCKAESIERLIAAAASASSSAVSSSNGGGGGGAASPAEQVAPEQSAANSSGGAPQIIDALCDADVIDWKL